MIAVERGIGVSMEYGIKMKNKEIWKDIKNYEGLYQVSNLGRVKSLYKKQETILKYQKNKTNLLKISIFLSMIKSRVKTEN